MPRRKRTKAKGYHTKDGGMDKTIIEIPLRQATKILKVYPIDIEEDVSGTPSTNPKRKGPQRRFVKEKAQDYSQSILAEAALLGPILGNVRNYSQEDLDGPDNISLPGNIDISVFDRQHSLEALKMAAEEDESLWDKPITCFLYFQPTEHEYIMFHFINSMGTNTQSDHKCATFAKMYAMKKNGDLDPIDIPGVTEEFDNHQVDWLGRGGFIAMKLGTSTESPLNGLVKIPGDGKSKIPIQSNIITTALVGREKDKQKQGLLKTQAMEELGDDELVTVISNILKGIEAVWPEPFEEAREGRCTRSFKLLRSEGFGGTFVLACNVIDQASTIAKESGKHFDARLLTPKFFQRAFERTARNLDADALPSGTPMNDNHLEFWSQENPKLKNQGSKNQLAETHLVKALGGPAPHETHIFLNAVLAEEFPGWTQ